ncbi:MAG: lytic transglycosylase domain-containing protein [Candidatus Vecturithrix sp.]|nr:lytic transglycosylase domain-containing protein [Candidatus Vecturithrix sp.]
MKNQRTTWRMLFLLGTLMFLASSCAPPSLDVFLSPNPNFEDASPVQATSLQQQYTPHTPLQPVTFAGAPLVQPTVVQPSVEYTSGQPASIQTFAGYYNDNRLVLQLNETMREAEALILSGEARLQEQNPLEAIREFERARLLLEQDFGPTLQYVEQQSTIQGGVGILSMSEIQRLRDQQTTLLMRINQSYDFETMYEKKYAEEKFETLRRTNIVKTQPISAPGIPSSSRVLLQPRPISSTMPSASWLNVSWLPAEDIDRAIEQFRMRAADFRSCLAQANQHFPQVTSILSQEGVPQELAYIALIESGYQPSARSSSGSAGLWQLSKSVARSYGLNTSSSSDERLSVTTSTRAFARYIKDLQRRFGNWELAILGYHLGENALRGAVNYVGTSDPQRIVAYSSSARAYLSKFAASMMIANNPNAYGFDGALSNMSGQYVHHPSGGQYSDKASAGMFEPPVVTLY